jgi:NADP-dependent 3-hydroxy acid dehydrogenase YdfG
MTNVLITGASKGIGLAIAHTLAGQQQEKYNFGLCSRNINEIVRAEAELGKHFPLHRYYSRKCDVSDAGSVKEFVAGFEERFGGVDILINNAGFGRFGSVAEMETSTFTSVLDTNLRGVFLMTQAVLPRMREKHAGTIITISSLAGRNGFKGGAAYCAAKFAVRGLMNSLFLEVRSENIRVVTIFPGTVETAFFDTLGQPTSVRTATALQAQDIADAVVTAIALPQRATISELDIRPTNPKQ